MNQMREANPTDPDAVNPINSGATLDPVRAIENDREFKAHLYQHLSELQPFLGAESQISVLVQLEANREGEGPPAIILALVATLADARLEAEGRSHNLYEAFAAAKEMMIQVLEDHYSATVSASEREAEIHALLSGRYNVH